MENGARPVASPWALQTELVPLGRLGALVFQPDATETSKWAETKCSDPDSRLCQEPRTPANTRLEKRFSTPITIGMGPLDNSPPFPRRVKSFGSPEFVVVSPTTLLEK